MTHFAYSAIADASVLDFDPRTDLLWFDTPGVSAGELRLTVVGESIRIDTPELGFTLRDVSLSGLDGSNLVFADGSSFVNSPASSLYANDLAGGGGDDLLVGGAALLPMVLASESTTGVQGNGSSFAPNVCDDGRYVAFTTASSNLVGTEFNATYQVYVKDLLTGVLTRVSTNASGDAGNGASTWAALSRDGRSLTFMSYATNLVSGDTNGSYDIFFKNLDTGAIARVSSRSDGAQGNGDSTESTMSADGGLVCFQSYATNLVDGDTNAVSDIFVKNLATGGLSRVSTSFAGGEANGYNEDAMICADGTHVAFTTGATNLGYADANSASDVYVKDLSSGGLTRVSTTRYGVEGDSYSYGASISANGRYVAFASAATNLVTGDTNGALDVFVKDLQTGALTRVSTDASGVQGNFSSSGASISADGRFVAFVSTASNLVAGDTNSIQDVYVKDLLTGAISRISTDADGIPGNGACYGPMVSADGSRVVFESYASNLVPGDTLGMPDVFVVANPLESRVLTGGAGNDSYLISNPHDRIVEAVAGGSDTVLASIDFVLPDHVERLELQGAANLSATGNLLANVLVGNAGDNLIDGREGVDTASYAQAAEGVAVDLGTDEVQDTGDGLDRLMNIENLIGSAHDDALFGGADANQLDGGAGADLLVGGSGNDVYVVDSVGDAVIERAGGGADTVRSWIAVTLGAELENAVLLGTAGVGATGNANNNILVGNRGNNTLNGGAGLDTASYVNARVGVQVSLDLVGPQSTRGAGADTLVSIENLTGSAYDDSLHGNAGTNVLNGGSGTDTLSYARAGAAVAVSLALTTAQATGGGGSDTVLGFENLIGSAYADTLTGSGAANVLDGGAGADTLVGGGGNDTYRVDSAGDVVTEAAGGGTDTVITGVSRSLGAEQENLTLAGTASINAAGNTLANVLTGNGSANVLNGGGGADTANYAGAVAAVSVNLAAGLASGGGGSDTLISIENVVGSDFADALVGSAAVNVLTGGAGADTLTGGASLDAFVFTSLAGADTVVDFVSGTDRVWIGRAGITIGDGDIVVEGATTVAGPGGFATSAELVVVTSDVAGAITEASAAAVIGSASTGYGVGVSALFVVDNGSSSAIYRFQSLDTNAVVSAGELTLLATLNGTAQTAVGDYFFAS